MKKCSGTPIPNPDPDHNNAKNASRNAELTPWAALVQGHWYVEPELGDGGWGRVRWHASAERHNHLLLWWPWVGVRWAGVPECTYESIMGLYLKGAKGTQVEDPYIRLPHHIQNFFRFCEAVLKVGKVRKISLTSFDDTMPLAETINGLHKAELIHRRGPWKARESVELATLQWVHWFNHVRLLKPIGGIPPAEAEANYWRQLAASDTSTEVTT
jgi:hypothetical protein